MTSLQSTFAYVFQSLAHVDAGSHYVFITADQANAAFSAALMQTGVAAGATLDLGYAPQRGQIFGVLEQAIGTLETTLGTNFAATTLSGL